ncbi:hypothetical protein CTAYLR_002536 [Chrysophaeum taylorii]|uniref:Uncharacterized protein n=1 Tax=Chrysophaeum taylorii TaxID=2483200 RepID=A0AAD7UGY6_9STRA|nr:hypothetical protein CTAYLR_002536 [Chrysophaeum taylorii]
MKARRFGVWRCPFHSRQRYRGILINVREGGEPWCLDVDARGALRMSRIRSRAGSLVEFALEDGLLYHVKRRSQNVAECCIEPAVSYVSRLVYPNNLVLGDIRSSRHWWKMDVRGQLVIDKASALTATRSGNVELISIVHLREPQVWQFVDRSVLLASGSDEICLSNDDDDPRLGSRPSAVANRNLLSSEKYGPVDDAYLKAVKESKAEEVERRQVEKAMAESLKLADEQARKAEPSSDAVLGPARQTTTRERESLSRALVVAPGYDKGDVNYRPPPPPPPPKEPSPPPPPRERGPAPAETRRPAIDERKGIDALVEYLGRYKRGVSSMVASLKANNFDEWRAVRGDGNCYYRSVAFGIVEALALSGRGAVLLSIRRRLERCDVSQIIDEFGASREEMEVDHAAFLDRLDAVSGGGLEPLGFELAIATEPRLDAALVRAARCVVADFVRDHATASMQTAKEDLLRAKAKILGDTSPRPDRGGDDDDLTVAIALGHFEDANDLCASPGYLRILTMGEDAEGLVCDLAILPSLLGGDCRTWAFFDQTVKLVVGDLRTPGGAPAVDIALNPGHYFILYAKQSPPPPPPPPVPRDDDDDDDDEDPERRLNPPLPLAGRRTPSAPPLEAMTEACVENMSVELRSQPRNDDNVTEGRANA